MCSISTVPIYYEPESEIRVKCYDHLNFSKAFVVHFQASCYIMGLTHTPESKFMAVWVCRELSCSISTVSIYYAHELDICVKSYYHSYFSRASVVHFQASWYIMGLNRTPMSKVMAVWIGRELSCSILTALIYFAPKSDIQGYSYDILNFSGASVVHFLPYRYIMVSIIQPSQKLWLFEFAESFHVLFRVSWYIMRLNWTSEWKVMTISISRELPLFNFERLDILRVWIGHPSEKLWPFEFLEIFRGSISGVSICDVLESDLRVKIMTIWISRDPFF